MCAPSGVNPFFHYLARGRGEGRKPNPVGALAMAEADGADRGRVGQRRSGEDCRERRRSMSIVPVYRGYDDTLASIHAVLANAQQTPFNLLVVNDRSPEPALTDALRGCMRAACSTISRMTRISASCARSTRRWSGVGSRDVIILNSDAIVHGDWIDRLLAHARRDAKIATITPFSNNATICSYPVSNQDNMLALEASLAELDDFAKACNAGARTVVPTGVGFCMYMRRAVIDEIGVFDAEAFGHGYGEECDFCRRAAEGRLYQRHRA